MVTTVENGVFFTILSCAHGCKCPIVEAALNASVIAAL